MDSQNIINKMTERGYTMHSHNPQKTFMSFMSKDHPIFADVSVIEYDAKKPKVVIELKHIDGLLTLSTGTFSFWHKRFKDLFEAKMIEACIKLSAVIVN